MLIRILLDVKQNFIQMKYLPDLLTFIILNLLSAKSFGQTTAQWRGPERNGIYKETNLMKSWPENGPQLLWAAEEIGTGYSSPVVADGRIFINGEINRIAHIFAFDLNGQLLWKAPNGPEFFGEGYAANFPGARSAPTVFNDLVYVCSGLGQIACLEAASGKVRWTLNMVTDLGGKLNMFGYSESLMVDETKVYCYPGGKESNVMALDRMTGKPVWTSKALGDPVSFCSPMMIRLPKPTANKSVINMENGELIRKTVTYPELEILVTLSREYLLGIDAKTGELLWSHKEDSVKLEGEHCNTPLYSDGFIYCISADKGGNGAYKLALSPDGKSVKEVWRNGKVRNPLGGFIKIGDRIFTSSEDKKLKVIDTNSGQVTDSIRNIRGNIISADNLIFFYSDNGYVHLIKNTNNQPEIVSKFKIDRGTREHFSHPVISNGVLYIRHGSALMAYQIK